MSNDAQEVFDSALSIVTGFFSQPWVKEYYRREAAKKAAEYAKEQAAALKARQEAETKKERERAYDAYVLSGGSDECFRFGHSSGCAPHCPVYMRGACENGYDGSE